MTETRGVAEHYRRANLGVVILAALDAAGKDIDRLTPDDLAPIDELHSRGREATVDLARSLNLKGDETVLDLGCGIGGPARYLAANFGCKVTGVDLSPGFIEAAIYLTARCGLSDRVMFQVGDAMRLPFEDAAFDVVFLQHVAMNIEDRDALYVEIRRILVPGGRFATYDLVLRDGDVVFPAPWAPDALTSFLFTESATRAALERAGFKAILWRDDTQTARDWFKAAMAGPPPSGLHLGVVMGPDFQAKTANLARNLRENRLGVLSAIMIRD